LSILIPTLESRRESFAALHAKLMGQVRENGLTGRAEVIHLRDSGERSTGAKRNDLMRKAQGTFIVSVDDDDDVSDTYLVCIVGALDGNSAVDCVGITGEVTYRGTHARKFVCSTRNEEYCTKGGVVLMPPNHLNPVRRSIALQYEYEDVSRGEDSDRATRMSRARALRREVFLDETLYYYNSRRSWAYQALVERTEFLRHPLGFRLYNRHRLRRWVRSTFSAARVHE
jgi:hypothetical protein